MMIGQVHCLFEEITDCMFNLYEEVIYVFVWEISVEFQKCRAVHCNCGQNTEGQPQTRTWEV